jgi:hypothetical protein
VREVFLFCLEFFQVKRSRNDRERRKMGFIVVDYHFRYRVSQLPLLTWAS